jgi:hypothetical protein
MPGVMPINQWSKSRASKWFGLDHAASACVANHRSSLRASSHRLVIAASSSYRTPHTTQPCWSIRRRDGVGAVEGGLLAPAWLGPTLLM